MPDREKYIEVLSKTAKAVKEYNEDVPITISLECVEDILELLKEHETADTGRCRIFQCKKCGFGIDDIFVNDEEKYQIVPRYCPNCGRSVKWE